MSDTGVQVRFSGDTTALQSSINAAKTAMSGFGTAATALGTGAKTVGSTVEGLAAVMRDIALTIAAVTYVAKPALSALNDLGNSMSAAEGRAALFGAQMVKASAASSLSGMADAQRGVLAYAESFSQASASGGRFSVQQTGFMASVSNGIRAVDNAVTGTIANIQAWYRGIAIYNSGLIESEKASASAAMGIMNFADAAQLGGIGSATETLRALTGEIVKIPDISDASAGAIQNMLLTIPNYSVSANEALITLIQQFSRNGDEAVANAKKITAAFADPQNGGTTLGNMVAQLRTMQDIQSVATRIVGSFKDSAQASQFLATTIAAVKEANDRTNQGLIEQLESIKQFGPLARVFEIGIMDQVNAQLRVNEELTKTLGLLQKAVDLQKQIADQDQRQKTLLENINSANTPTGRLDDAEEKQKSLKATSRKQTDDVEVSDDEKSLAVKVAILEAANQTDEGILGVLNVMKNRLNAGYGNYGSTLTQVIEKPKAFSAYSPQAVAGVSEDDPQYKRVSKLYDETFGDDPKDDPTKGATHYYNPNLAAPDWGSKMSNVSQIGDHKFGNPDGPPVLSSDQDQQRIEALQQIQDSERKIKAEKAGGTDEEQTQLEIAQKNATTAKDEVADAEKLVEVRKKAVEEAKDGTPEEQRKAAQSLAQAEIDLNTKVAAQKKSEDELALARIPENTRARLDAQVAMLSEQQKAYAQDSAQWNALEQQKVEATKKFNDQEKADTAAAEDAKFNVLKEKTQEKINTLHEQASVGMITQAQETAAVKAALAEQEAAARAHFAMLAALWPQGTAEHRKAVQQQTQDAEKELAAQVAASNKATIQIYDSYKQQFEKIGSTIASSLASIIEGTGNWRQLMQNVAKQILNEFVQMGVKWVADWAARQAASVALTVSGESAKTGAVAAGEAARTSLGISGSIAQAATTLASIGKSIMASAAEAFAGVFGFLSPVLGPAAAGPAAAAEATVLGAKSLIGGSFAVGSWSLPGDMLAQVHQGEMIVPAAATPWMQSLAANAAGGGGAGGGGDTHVHLNVTAMDAQSVMSLFRNNARDIANMIGKTMALNPSTRGKY